MNLQQQVQQHLDNTGISLRELSRRSGVSHTTIGKILRGGNYKSDTAHALYSLISITPISEYVTLHDKVEAIAADRVDCDVMTRDDAMECGKQRRIEALEAEVQVWRDKAAKVEKIANETLKDYLGLSERCTKQEQRISDANAEIKRLTVLAETHGQSWKAACVQVEQLQKQLDHGQTAYSKLHNQVGETRTKYETQLEAANQKEARLQKQLTDVYAAKTRQEAQIMRLRVYVWILIAALVFVVASGFMVLRGAV